MFISLVLFFFVFSVIISSVIVLFVSNRIYSILYLIYIYLCSAILFMYFGIYIVGLFYFLVYIGAVAVLFLFSVMILDLKEFYYDRDYTYFISIFFLILFLAFQYFLVGFDSSNFTVYSLSYEYNIYILDFFKLLGILLFNYYSFLLIVAALLLLIAMVGAILLTHTRSGFYLRRTDNQLFRTSYLYNVSIY